MRAYTLSLSPSLPHSWKKKYIKSYLFHARKISNISVVNYRETPHACLRMSREATRFKSYVYIR